MDRDAVKNFYDDFLESRMLDYRISGNRRIDRAVARILQFVQSDHHVLDIGCGIGIAAEQIAKHLKEGQLWACDISEKNVWYANKTVETNKINFFVADVIGSFEKIRSQITSPLDVVAMVDVIEHLPKSYHEDLFQNLSSIGAPHSFVVLTYPSPQYQKYLRQNEPDELQIVDEVVSISRLLHVAEDAGYQLRHFSMEAMGYENQYIHCVFQKEPLLTSSDPPNFFEKVVGKIRHTLDSLFLRPKRKKKFIDDVFGEMHGHAR